MVNTLNHTSSYVYVISIQPYDTSIQGYFVVRGKKKQTTKRYGNANRAVLKLLIRVKWVALGWDLMYHRLDFVMQEEKKKTKNKHSLSQVYNMHTQGK